jgi:hypothetical protein
VLLALPPFWRNWAPVNAVAPLAKPNTICVPPEICAEIGAAGADDLR